MQTFWILTFFRDVKALRKLIKTYILPCKQLFHPLSLSCLAAKPGVYDYTVVNDDLELAYQDLKAIISKVSKE